MTPADAMASPVHARNRSRTLLAVVLIIALAIRLALALSRPADEASLRSLPDQAEYLAIARNALHGQGFYFRDPGFNQMVYAYRMPGYPLFIAALGGNVTAVRIAQSVIDVASVVAVFLIARRFIPGWPLWVAVCFVAFNPYLIYFSALILSETLFTAMLIWAMWAILQANRGVCWTGIVVAVLSIYVRPSAVLLPAVLAMSGAVMHGRTWRATITAGGVALLLTAVLLAPWGWRNQRVVNHWIWGTTNSGFTLYDGFNPSADGSSNQADFRAWPQLRYFDEVERSDYLAGLAKDFAISHPAKVVGLTFAKIIRLWSPVPLSSEYGSRKSYVVVGLLFSVPLFVLTIAGVFNSRLGRSRKLYLLAPALYFTAVHGATVGSLRYRVPADVPMAILAAAGADGLRSRRKVLTRKIDVD